MCSVYSRIFFCGVIPNCSMKSDKQIAAEFQSRSEFSKNSWKKTLAPDEISLKHTNVQRLFSDLLLRCHSKLQYEIRQADYSRIPKPFGIIKKFLEKTFVPDEISFKHTNVQRSFPDLLLRCHAKLQSEVRAGPLEFCSNVLCGSLRRAAEAAEAAVRLGGAQWRHHSTCLRTKWPLLMMERMGISASVSHLEDRILHVVNTRCQNI